MSALPRPPTGRVLAQFGLCGSPQPLPGGQGSSWRVGEAVLKAQGDPVFAAWQGELLTRLDGRDDFRVCAPLRSADGHWEVHGWTASRYEPGAPVPRSWRQVIRVGRQLSAALVDEPRPAFLSARRDRWAVADRTAWGEQPAGPLATAPHVPRLLAGLEPAGGRPQLVHGDLSGNVLFADGLLPLVLDLSPYWRPPAYASAVVVADALVGIGAQEDVVQEDVQALLDDADVPQQHLLRALLFRILADLLAGRDDVGVRYAAAVELATCLAGRPGSRTRHDVRQPTRGVSRSRAGPPRRPP